MNGKTHAIRTAITVAAISAPSAISAGAQAVDPVDDGRQLQADEHEERRVEQEGDDLPDGVALDPGRRRGQPRGQPAHVDADGDRGEDAGDPERLGRQVGEVGGEQGDRDLDRRVVEPAADGRDDRAPTAIPTAIPPTTLTTNSPLASSRLKLPVRTAATANL